MEMCHDWQLLILIDADDTLSTRVTGEFITPACNFSFATHKLLCKA